MRFAGENELHRPRGVVEQTVQPLLVAEQKRAAFVGGETARETDRQNFRIENAVDAADRFRRFAQRVRARSRTRSRTNSTRRSFSFWCVSQSCASGISITPRQKSGSVRCSSQSPRYFCVERGELRRHPRLGMHAVGDARDRNFVSRHAGPDIFPKRSADFAVQFAHAVRLPAHAQRQNRHAESIERIRRCV